MNTYTVTHRRAGRKPVTHVVCRKSDATDMAYSLVARTRSSSATVKRTSGVITWGKLRGVRSITFFWKGQHIGTRYVRTRKPKAIAYTHRDSSNMGWRFVGSRPVSALADKVMADCGMAPL